MNELISIKGFPKYHLETETLRVISYHKTPLGAYRSLEMGDLGQQGYTLYNDGFRSFWSLDKLRGVVELHKIKGMIPVIKTSITGPVRKGYWIVGSIDKQTGRFSTSTSPAMHETELQAKTEAGRLAMSDKTKKFVWLKVGGLATAADVIYE